MRDSATSISPPFELVSFDLENAPKIERKAEPPKKKEKKPEQNAQASQSAAAVPAEKEPPVSAPDNVPEKKDKKEKKEKKPKEATDVSAKKKAGGKAAEPEDAGEPVPSMIDLRVGRIVDGQSMLNLLIYI